MKYSDFPDFLGATMGGGGGGVALARLINPPIGNAIVAKDLSHTEWFLSSIPCIHIFVIDLLLLLFIGQGVVFMYFQLRK